jgi:LysM repeat protein
MAQITIQKGQTLSGIAKQQGTTVDAIMKANPTIKNANLIYAGSSLNLPGSPTSPVVAPREHTGPVRPAVARDVDLMRVNLDASHEPAPRLELRAPPRRAAVRKSREDVCEGGPRRRHSDSTPSIT